MKIELVTTTNADLHETGFGTRSACDQFVRAATRANLQIQLSVCESLADLNAVVARKPDLVVLAVKYIQPRLGERTWLSAYFAEHHIEHTGSLRRALNRDSDKMLAKESLMALGIPSAAYFEAGPDDYQSALELPLSFPLFVKPNVAANGNGIDDLSYVTNFAEFRDKVSSIFAVHGCPAVVEEYLGGREFTVSIIETDDGLLVSPIEITPPLSAAGHRMLGQAVKQSNTETLSTIVDHELKYQIGQLAIEAFRGLGARGFGRIDIKTDSCGVGFFMEANLVPGMSEGSSYFPCGFALDLGLSYQDVVKAMVDSTRRTAPVADRQSSKLTADSADLDCLSCGACCYQRPGTILVSASELTRYAKLERHDILEQMDPGHFSQMAFRMSDSGACVHHGAPGAPHACQIYELRGDTCREFAAGSPQCLEFRRDRHLATKAR